MIYPTSRIKCLDIQRQQHRKCTMNELYQEYIYFVEYDENDIASINLSKQNIKTCDWYGWTQLLEIKKVPVDKWVTIKINDYEPPLIVAANSLVPVYDITNPVTGFHGEVKYHFNLKPASELTKNDLLRAWRYIEYDHRFQCNCGTIMGKKNKGVKCNKCESLVQYKELLEKDFWYPSEINRQYLPYSHGFEVVTKSGYVNINNFHLYTRKDNPEKNHVK